MDIPIEFARRFPILRLPYVLLRVLISILNPLQIIILCQCSKRMRDFVLTQFPKFRLTIDMTTLHGGTVYLMKGEQVFTVQLEQSLYGNNTGLFKLECGKLKGLSCRVASEEKMVLVHGPNTEASKNVLEECFELFEVTLNTVTIDLNGLLPTSVIPEFQFETSWLKTLPSFKVIRIVRYGEITDEESNFIIRNLPVAPCFHIHLRPYIRFDFRNIINQPKHLVVHQATWFFIDQIPHLSVETLCLFGSLALCWTINDFFLTLIEGANPNLRIFIMERPFPYSENIIFEGIETYEDERERVFRDPEWEFEETVKGGRHFQLLNGEEVTVLFFEMNPDNQMYRMMVYLWKQPTN